MNARCFLFTVATVLFCHAFACLAGDVMYKVVPNKSGFPYPTMLPDITAEERNHFDWKKYIETATSPADKAYRALEAPPEFRMDIPGGDLSNSGEYTRLKLAEEEQAKQCTRLENAYRERLRSNDPQALKILELFIEHRKQAMNAEVELIGGSWGGSGAKTAWAGARLSATLSYLASLKELKTSLHFQDMAE